MAYRGQEIGPFNDFGGGQNSNNPSDTIGNNQGMEVENVIILPNGRGIRSRPGDTEFNSSAMVSGSTPVSGLKYYKQADGTEYLTAVAGTKFFKSDSLDGTMDDVTGAITITAGQNNIWTPFVAENVAVYVGGAPDAPFKWTGSGNAAVLGGSPPSGNFGFYHNNRAFIGNTTANPSRIQWSVLADIEDWSGTGSGSQDVLTNDGDTLVGAGVMNEYTVLLFKQNTVHKLIGRVSPFPVTEVFRNTGAVGKNAIVTVDGLCYFITPKARMEITDGARILSPQRIHDVDNVWDGLNSSRLQYIQGRYYEGKNFRWIIWTASNGSSTKNDIAIIWDITNQCWIKNPAGFDCNVMDVTQDGTLYAGHYDGKIYKKLVEAVYTDASESSAAITAKWRSGWRNFGQLYSVKHLDWVVVGAKTETSGKINVRVGADFSEDLISEKVDLSSPGMLWGRGIWGTGLWGGRLDFLSPAFVDASLRGNLLQIEFDNKDDAETFQLNQFSLLGNMAGQKEMGSI
jgi:hypothetical protein